MRSFLIVAFCLVGCGSAAGPVSASPNDLDAQDEMPDLLGDGWVPSDAADALNLVPVKVNGDNDAGSSDTGISDSTLSDGNTTDSGNRNNHDGGENDCRQDCFEALDCCLARCSNDCNRDHCEDNCEKQLDHCLDKCGCKGGHR